jgi:hypothetical protein
MSDFNRAIELKRNDAPTLIARAVPASLQPLIRAVRGLNDFNPKPGVRPSGRAPRAAPGTAAPRAVGSGRPLPHPNTYYSGQGQYPGYVGPSDFAVIYN